MNAQKPKLGEPVVLLDFSMASIRQQEVPEYATRRFLDAPAPGIVTTGYILRKLVKACETSIDDMDHRGALSYNTLEMMRDAVALAKKP